MAAKPAFTPAQQVVIKAAAQRVWKKKFKWMKKTQHHPAGQEAMALALGISQQTVSELLKDHGKYNPGIKVAAAIANLDGQTLEQLVGEYAEPEPAAALGLKLVPANGTPSELPNIDVCVKFFEGQKTWKPWTIAAARAGLFGEKDLPAAIWADRLDSIEKALEKIRPDIK